MSFINKYLRNFTPYKVASHKVWNVSADERKEILKLDWNEATISPSPKVKERIDKIVKEGNFYNLYPMTYNEELLRLLAQYSEVPEKNIQYFASSDSLHEYIAKLFITVGDPILLLGPTYDNFRLTAEVCGGNIFYFYLDDQFGFDKEAFVNRIKEINPSIVYICNPNNPTGTKMDIDYIEYLITEFNEVLFLIDEAYMEFSDGSAKNLAVSHENLLVSRTMSKAFALANFRFGYLIAHEKNIGYISSIRNPKNITTFAQEAAIGVLSDVDYMKAYVAEVNKAKEMFINAMSKYNWIKAFPSEGNFVLLECSESAIKTKLIQYLETNNIFVRNISQTEHIKDYCIRITIGTSEQMMRVVEIFKMFDKECNNE